MRISGSSGIALGVAMVAVTAGVGFARPVEYHVAIDGRDANTGTARRPFATLERARDAVRERQPGAAATVWIRGGLYRRTTTFELRGAADSGTKDAPVVYRAVPGESVRLSGGTPLAREWFAPVRDTNVLSRIIDEGARGKLLAANLRAHGVTEYGEITRHGFHRASERYKVAPAQLYVGGRRMTLARWPNEGTVSRTRIVDPGPKGTADTFQVSKPGDEGFWERGGTFAYDFDRPEKWTQARDIWVDGVHSWSWEWSYNKVAAIDLAKKEITLRYGEQSGLFNAYSGNAFHFENLLEEIDRPGEYFLDRSAGVLYLLPPPEFDKAGVEIELTTLDRGLWQAERVSFVTVRDLIFELGRGGIAVQANGGEGVRIESCEVRNWAGNGIIVSGLNHGVARCHVHHVGETGICLRGGDFATLTPGGCYAEDNEVDHFAEYQRVYRAGINLGLPGHVGQRASHNHIHHGPHAGMYIYGNDNLVENNEFNDVVLEFTDMGAIDMNAGARPFERGTVIRRNYFHHIGQTESQQNGVYPDNFTMGVTIVENVFQRIGGAGPAYNCRAININGGSYVVCRSNLFVDCTIPCHLSDHAGRNLYEQTVPQWKAYFAAHAAVLPVFGKRYPELLRFWDEPRQFPESNVFAGNIVLNKELPLLKEYGRDRVRVVEGALDLSGKLRVENNYVGETPGGVIGSDGRLALDDRVFGLLPGFPKLSLSEVGPRGPTGPHGK